MLSYLMKKNAMYVGSIAVSFGVIYAFGHKFVKWAWYLRVNQLVKQFPKKVFVVSDASEWEDVADNFTREARSIGAVGFDCEWVTVRGSRRPVALLQLATHTGLCVLIRLCEMKEDIPNSLRDLLNDHNILKCGVSCLDDRQYLAADYKIQVNGCLDLRHLAIQIENLDGSHADSGGLGLRSLSAVYLNRKLNKNWKLRRGDWEAPQLLPDQISYAADDALVGVYILLVVLGHLIDDHNFTLSNYLCSSWWENITLRAIKGETNFFTDRKFSYPKKGVCVTKGSYKYEEKKKKAAANLSQTKTSTKGYTTRKTPLYHNCLLYAPDDQPLCTCDPRKAQWYIDKDLGEKISDDPFIVRLKFEPCGRPQKEGGDGYFYLQDRLNICVVCGKDNSYFRKSVIPHDYRKHFPEIMKAHQSHDVLLLCVSCHLRSSQFDNILRCQLAEVCNAPIGQENDVKVKINSPLKAVRSAGGALLKSRHKIPAERIKQLEGIIMNHYGVEELTEAMIHEASNLDLQVVNPDFVSHSSKVYSSYEKIGVIKFELKWRKYFIDTMKPKFMPTGWSVHHNHKKLELKMSRLPLDHPEREDYKIALVGSEGTIDVPYIPQNNNRTDELLDNLNGCDEANENNFSQCEGNESLNGIQNIIDQCDSNGIMQVDDKQLHDNENSSRLENYTNPPDNKNSDELQNNFITCDEDNCNLLHEYIDSDDYDVVIETDEYFP